MEGNAYDSKAVLVFRSKNRTNHSFRSKILFRDINNIRLKKVERQRPLSLSLPAAFPRGTREIISPRDARARTLAMVKRKKMRGLIVVARAGRIYRSWLEEGLRSAGRGKLPFAPTCQASVVERIIPMRKFPIGCDFLLSSKSRETSIILLCPLVTLYETFICR